MEFDLEITNVSVDRCFLIYDEMGYGYDEDENGFTVNFSEADIGKVTWYIDNDDCDVETIVTVRVQEVFGSPTPKVIITWHDEAYKDNVYAIRLLEEAKSDLISEY